MAFVLGQSDDYSGSVNSGGVSASSLYGVEGLASANGRFFAADRINNRVLIWNSIPSSMDQPADLVLGQPNLFANAPGLSQSTFNNPTDVSTDGTRLVVADAYNQRVLIWNSLPLSNQVPADVVLGQPNFTSNAQNNGGIGPASLNYPWGVKLAAGKLFVADASNSRVLIWNTVPSVSGAPADLVLGQASFTASTTGLGAGGMTFPNSVCSDGIRLMVADSPNNRVLIFNSIPTVSSTAADLVLGQPNFTSNTSNNGGISASSFSNPYGMAVFFGSLYVADSGNNRVLAWNSFPTVNGAPADRVIGQPGFATNTSGTGPNSMYNPIVPLPLSTSLFISEFSNNRISVYSCLFVPSPTSTATVSPTFSGSPTNSPSPTISPTFSVSPTNSPSPTISPTFSVSPTISPSPTASPTCTASPTATSTPTPPALVLVDCASESTAGWPSTGSLTVGVSNSFVPLCNGWVITGNDTLNQIKLVNVLNDQAGPTYQLSASPDYMAYDSVNGILYVSQLSSDFIARLDLVHGTQSSFAVASQPSSLALGPPGTLFVGLQDWPDTTVEALNSTTGAVNCSVQAPVDQGCLAYDSVHSELFASETQGSPGDIDGFAYNSAGPTLTQNQTLSFTILSFSRYPAAVSPDGLHLAANVEGVSNLYYSGWTDFNPVNMAQRSGKWASGANAFSPDSQYVVEGDSTGMYISSVPRHMLLQSNPGSLVGTAEEAAFSPGQGIAYVLCNNQTGSSTLHWMLVNATLAPTPIPSPIAMASISCTSDVEAGLPASGTITLPGPATDLMPLCSGYLITENQADNTVVVRDPSGAVLSTYALPATPLKMTLDAADGWLYVACDSDDQVMKLDLAAGTLSTIELSSPAYSVAVDSGTVDFASLDSGWPQMLSIFNGTSEVQATSQHTDTYMAADLFFDPVADNLFQADAGIYLERDAFDPGTLTLTMSEENESQPAYAALAPGGAHLAATSQDAGSYYIDYDAPAFSTTYGDWTPASYPGPCSFSPDGTGFLGTDDNAMYVFSTADHALQQTFPLGAAAGTKPSRARFSRGGSLVYSVVSPYGSTASTVVWAQNP